jgi:dolichol-phosphate mannosyltransferase
MERSIGSESQPLVSVVVPAFNEEGNIDLLYEAVSRAIETTGLRFELLFVDDGSKDATLQHVLALRHRDPRVRPIALTRNFGHQAALVAGLEAARGDAVITMDCDMQHPPQLIPDMIAAWQRGFSIVQMIREDTIGVSTAKRTVSRMFYKLINMLSDTPITPDAADFQLLDRRALDSLLKLGDSRPFLRGMVAWLGYPRTELRYTAAARTIGHSSYDFRRMLNLSLDAVTNFSTKPLRIAFYLGCVSALLSLVYLVYIVITFVRGSAVEGWSSLMVVLLFLGATQLMTLGILGEYIGRIFDQTRARPRYLAMSSPAEQADDGLSPSALARSDDRR